MPNNPLGTMVTLPSGAAGGLPWAPCRLRRPARPAARGRPARAAGFGALFPGRMPAVASGGHLKASNRWILLGYCLSWRDLVTMK